MWIMDHYGKPNISTIDFLGNYFYVYFIFPQIPSMESSKEKTYSMPTPFNVETSQVYNSMSGLGVVHKLRLQGEVDR